MSGDEDRFSKGDHDGVIDKLLDELGVDNDMKKELVDSGRVSSDLLKVASAEQVRRRMEIEKSIDRVRDSLNMLERDVAQIENSVDKIERDLVPVVLSFLVSLKGSLVNIRNTVIDQSKRQAKTNLQATFADTTVRSIVQDKFLPVEESLSSEMSAPIMDKIREITDAFKAFLKVAMDEMTNLKETVEDYTQRTSTEMEFLTRELSMKPRIEVPKDVQDEMSALKRNMEEASHELKILDQRLENREAEIIALQTDLAATKLRNDNLEETLTKLRSAPTADVTIVTELRQTIKALEAQQEILERKLAESHAAVDSGGADIAQLKQKLAEKEIEVGDYQQKAARLESEVNSFGEKLEEIDELRARVRTLESGDAMRELERTRSEADRLKASNERLQNDHDDMKSKMEYAEARLNGYLSLMGSTEKTKAFLILEDSKEITLREVARSLGVSPAIMTQWAEDFVRLGLARIVDGTKMVLTIGKSDSGSSSSSE
jgi:chromosome segregation ATPase